MGYVEKRLKGCANRAIHGFNEMSAVGFIIMKVILQICYYSRS